jgi:hypothetical protein
MCEMLAPGLSSRDASWFARWCRSLDAASACLVVFTPNYLASANLTEHSNLRLEAAMIQKRLRRLRQRRLYRRNSFRLFVLDPYQVGQDYANLKLCTCPAVSPPRRTLTTIRTAMPSAVAPAEWCRC